MRTPPAVGVAGLLIAVGLAVRLLVPTDGDPSVFGAFGEQSEQRIYAEQVLGREPVVRDALGHDGRFFFVQAQDPYVTGDAAEWLDRPVYRSQRMLYPLLASGFGVLDGDGTLWGMMVVNLLAFGLGTWAAARLAVDHGRSAWWGLAFPLNLGMINEFGIGGAGVVAFALVLCGVLLLERDRVRAASVLFALAVLAREAMLLFVAGAVLYRWLHLRKRDVLPALVPVVAAGAWAGYVRAMLPDQGLDVQEIGWPFVGAVQAAPTWRIVDWVVFAILVYVSIALVVRASSHRSALAWGSVGFLVLAVVFTRQVWVNSYDITRAIAPAITAFVFVTFVDRRVSAGERQSFGPAPR